MRNPFVDYKILLSTFTYEEQVNKLNKINELAHKKQHGNIIDTRYERIKEFKHMRNNNTHIKKKNLHVQ